MNEHELNQALEPVIDELMSVTKRLTVLEQRPEPVVPVPDMVLDVNTLIQRLKQDAEFLQSVTGPGGSAPHPEAVAAILKSDRELIDALKPEPVHLDQVIDQLVEKHAEQLRGKPGQAPTVDAVVVELLANKAFIEAVTPQLPDMPEPVHGTNGADGAGIDSPAHVVGKVYREGAVVAAYLGQHYRAKVDTVATPGDSDDWQRIGAGGFRWCGLKPATVKDGDLFIDGGSLFGVVNGKAAMWVQRPKPAPYLKTMELIGGELVARLNNGESVACEIGNVLELADDMKQQRVDLVVALEELAALRKAVAELRKELATVREETE